ncbi:MAG: flagellar hook-basal body complex protein FliE [Bacteroidetes bacterium]|nr:flagellar hook-basal body complex protein FliE [Rhodothermaceae bacterium RA]RMH55111.1 MAG: flagellar hook-basal body complex protein FliE [Bacteroidota bacterium]
MNVAALQRLQSRAVTGHDGPSALPQPRTEAPHGTGFGKTLADAIERVDGAQEEAGRQISAFIAGEQENVHEVMIAMNQANLSFQLMTEVRNRVLETYQELMRMQV